MVSVELQNVVNQFAVPDKSHFETWALAIPTPNNESQVATIRIVDEPEMIDLNSQYRQKDGPTNVLSFPAQLHKDVDIPFIGDVVICAPVVINEAKQQGKVEESHWAHMTVHGILHLQGYDHVNEKDAQHMESLETQILNNLGFENPY